MLPKALLLMIRNISTTILKSVTILVMLFGVFSLQAQTKVDSTKKGSIIYVLENDYVEYITQDTLSVQRLVHNVKLLHDSDTIYCDSAIMYRQLNTAEAFGDVLIKQADGTEALADYMRYTGNNKKVVMRGNVQLSDGKGNELWSNDIVYNLKTKVGQYNNGGTLVSGPTMITSEKATYNMATKDARFIKNVVVNDPEYHVTSVDIGYNTTSKVATFFGPSVVSNEESILQTSAGTYASGDRTSRFWSRTSIFNDGQYIESDTLYYTKLTGEAIAIGNVIMIDTAQRNSTLYAGYAEYNELTKILLAYLEPVAKLITEKDTMYYRSDTMFSAPIIGSVYQMTAQDSIQKVVDELKGAVIKDTMQHLALDETGEIKDFSVDELLGFTNDSAEDGNLIADSLILNPMIQAKLDSLKIDTLKVNRNPYDLEGRHRDRKDVKAIKKERLKNITTSDSTTNSNSFVMMDSLQTSQTFYALNNNEEDTTKRYFLGYHNVRIFSDSLQGKCDSVMYNSMDSTVTMFIDPILWSNNNQLKGDVIILKMDSSELRQITVTKNSILVSQSGPDKAGFFDQIQGNVIKGYLTNNKIDSLTADINALNIYYIKDDDDYYSGVNETKTDRIEAYFKNDELHQIKYRGPTDGVNTPMREINPEALRLPRFKWHIDEKQKDLAEFLKGRILPEPQLWIAK